MSHVPNELAEDFPDQHERIQALKASNPQFAELVEHYHALNRDIHRVETRIQPESDESEEALKRQRLALKDAIAEALVSAR